MGGSLFAVLWLVLPASAASPDWLCARDAEVRELLSRMTLAEKVGQMTQPDLRAIKDFSDIENLGLGSILSGGSSDPKGGNSMRDWAGLYRSVQNRTARSRLRIPLLYGIDAVHGHNNVAGAVIFPHNIGLGCTRDPELVRRIARITAREMRATGIQWAFAPCVAVPRDIRWGRTYEGYSECSETVTSLGLAAMLGLQGERLTGREAVLGCAKHFVADGGTTFGTSSGGMLDQGDARIDEATMRSIHMAPYPALIDAGVGSVMPSFSSWNGEKCSGSRRLLTEILKDELGFKGFVISDYNAIDHLSAPAKGQSPASNNNNASGQVRSANYKHCVGIAINAGIDMVMVTDKYRDFIRHLRDLVNEGRVPMSRVDDAVTRILRVKFAMGLMDRDAAIAPDTELQRDFGSEGHRAVAREAVRRSLVLLKNERSALPLSGKLRHIHVTGRGADDLGMQCGGWTIGWQGARGEITTGGATILKALRAAAPAGTVISSSRDGDDPSGAEAVVVVIGEEPYAEMKGDRRDLSLAAEDLAAVTDAKSHGVPVIVVVLSGRPILLGTAGGQADAIVAAWWPGTEGRGVADVLFGDTPPTGRLSFAWPHATGSFPLGHGLGY